MTTSRGWGRRRLEPSVPWERGGQGREPDLWPEPSSPCLGNLWRFTALPAFSLSASLGAALAPARISPPASPAFPAQKLHFCRMKSESRGRRAELGAEGAAWLLLGIRSGREGDPHAAPNPTSTSALVGRPRSPPQPECDPLDTHRRRAPLYPRPREPSTAGPQPPPPPAQRAPRRPVPPPPTRTRQRQFGGSATPTSASRGTRNPQQSAESPPPASSEVSTRARGIPLDFGNLPHSLREKLDLRPHPLGR